MFRSCNSVNLFKHDLYFICAHFRGLQFFFVKITHPFYQPDQNVYQPTTNHTFKPNKADPLAGAGFVMAISIVGDGISGQA